MTSPPRATVRHAATSPGAVHVAHSPPGASYSAILAPPSPAQDRRPGCPSSPAGPATPDTATRKAPPWLTKPAVT